MSRYTNMKGIAAAGMAEHYAEEGDGDEFDSEEEEVIEELIVYFKSQFSRKEIIRVLDKMNWVENDVYDELEDLIEKRKSKKVELQLKKVPSSSEQQKKIKEQNTILPLLKKLSKEDSKDITLPLPQLQLTKSSSQQANEKKVGEYVQIERDVRQFNSVYPNVDYDIESVESSVKSKKNVNLVIIGHVDSGKSTLIGHLCHLKKVVDSKVVHKHEKESKNIGKESFKYAWVNDELDGERARGVTIDIGYKVIQTETKSITFLDAPGHKDFVPNMISGATQSDYALLVIEGTQQAFERGFGVHGSTKEHAFIMRQLGVERLIVVINKMDIIKWEKFLYEKIVENLKEFLASIGYNLDLVVFLPISAFYAQNILTTPAIPEAAWYDGPCLMQLLDSLEVPVRKSSMPMRLNVYSSYSSKYSGIVLQGKVEGGFVFEKAKAIIIPQGLMVSIKEITRDGSKVSSASIGENVDISIMHKEECDIRSGDVLCGLEYPIPTSKSFEAEVKAFELTYPILKSTMIVAFVNSAKCPGYIRKITAILDNEGNVLKKNPKCVRSFERAIVEVCIEKEICMELFSNYPSYGRVVLREKMATIAVGKITKIE